MSETTDALRLCPTRVDGTAVLFAHKVSSGQCQERQRGRYHKCFTCAHNNALVGGALNRGALQGAGTASPNGSPSLSKSANQSQRLGLRGKVHAG